MSAHRVSRLLLLVVIFLTPCSMAVESKKKKNQQILNETKEKEDEPKSGHFRARLKQVMQQVTKVRCDDPPSVSTRPPSKAGVQTPLPTKLPTVSPLELSTAIPSNLPSSSISFTEKPLPAKSVLPSVSPIQVS